MGRVFVSIILSVFLITPSARAAELQDFLMNCAYGTLAGALVGVASLAFTDSPSDHGSNIAKGASLGLYGGIIYGVVKLNEKPAPPVTDPYASLAPLYHQGQVDGAELIFHVGSF